MLDAPILHNVFTGQITRKTSCSRVEIIFTFLFRFEPETRPFISILFFAFCFSNRNSPSSLMTSFTCKWSSSRIHGCVHHNWPAHVSFHFARVSLNAPHTGDDELPKQWAVRGSVIHHILRIIRVYECYVSVPPSLRPSVLRTRCDIMKSWAHNYVCHLRTFDRSADADPVFR